MKVYILMENLNAALKDPETLDDIVLGVFSARNKAVHALRTRAIGINAKRGIQLFAKDGQAFDESGYLFLEVIEREVE